MSAFSEALAAEAGMGGVDETGDIVFAAGAFERLFAAANKVNIYTKSVAIELLEAKIADLEHHNHTLLVHNNELLARARAAEALVKSFGNSGAFQ